LPTAQQLSGAPDDQVFNQLEEAMEKQRTLLENSSSSQNDLIEESPAPAGHQNSLQKYYQ
jgi:hypothetical protein